MCKRFDQPSLNCRKIVNRFQFCENCAKHFGPKYFIRICWCWHTTGTHGHTMLNARGCTFSIADAIKLRIPNYIDFHPTCNKKALDCLPDLSRCFKKHSVFYQWIFPDPNGTQSFKLTQILPVFNLGQEHAEHPHSTITDGTHTLEGNQQDSSCEKTNAIVRAEEVHSEFPSSEQTVPLRIAPITRLKSQAHLFPCGRQPTGPGPDSCKHLKIKGWKC